MSIRLLIGRAGTGKTARCHSQIVDALRAQPLGPPIYWVVPRQITFSTERWLACDSGLDASARCRVVSFERLAEEVLAEHPGQARAVLSATARRAVVAHLLRQNAGKLAHFGPAADRPGLAAEVIELLDELARDGLLGNEGDAKDPLDLAAADLAAAGQSEDASLVRKLTDLRLIRDAYRAFLGPDRFDKDRRMQHVLRHVGACRRFRGATVYIDGFLEFMDFERRMILALCQSARELTLTLSMPADSPVVETFDRLPPADSVFHRVETTYRDLRLMLREAQLPVTLERLTSPVRFRSPALAAVEALFAGSPPASAMPDVAVERFEGQTPADEVEAVARRIRALTFQPPSSSTPPACRFRDILVLARDLAPYEREISRRFADHGISVFLDRRVDASAHPLVRAVRTLLAVATAGITTDSLLTLCRTGLLTACPADAVAELARWCTVRGIGGEAWTREDAATFPNAPPLWNTLRQTLVPLLQAWAQAWGGTGPTVTARSACIRLLQLADRLGLGQSLVNAPVDSSHAAEDQQVWAAVFGDGGLLEELADALGDEPITAENFAEAISAALAGIDLGMVPPTVDQVLVGQAERTRPGDARVVFVLGLSDGLFPARAEESPLLPDRERRRLGELHRPLRSSADRRALDERLFAYLAMTRAAERLIVSRPLTTTSGTPIAPSRYWTDLTPFVAPASVALASDPNSEPFLTAARWPHLIAAIAQWAAAGAKPDQPVAVAAYDLLRADRKTSPDVQPSLDALWPSLLRPDGKVTLDADLAAALYPDPVELEDRDLETFAACPFKHFVERVLRPEAPSPPRVKPYTLGHIARTLFERALGDAIVNGGDWKSLNLDQLHRKLQTAARDEIRRQVRRLTDDGSDNPDRLAPADRHHLSKAEGLIDDLIDAEVEAAGRTGFRPASVAVRFGSQQPLPPLEVPFAADGGTGVSRSILVRGTLARVDRDADDHVVVWRFAGSTKASVHLAKLYHGLQLRLLVQSLLVQQLAAEGHALGGEVVAAVELPLRSGFASVEAIDEYLEQGLLDPAERTAQRRHAAGPLNVDVALQLDKAVQRGEKSRLYNFKLNLNGQPSVRGSVLSPEAFQRLLSHAREVLAELSRQLVHGHVDVRPYKFGSTSACANCAHRPICRFNPRSGSGYRTLDLTHPDKVREALNRPTPTNPSA